MEAENREPQLIQHQVTYRDDFVSGSGYYCGFVRGLLKIDVLSAALRLCRG